MRPLNSKIAKIFFYKNESHQPSESRLIHVFLKLSEINTHTSTCALMSCEMWSLKTPHLTSDQNNLRGSRPLEGGVKMQQLNNLSSL